MQKSTERAFLCQAAVVFSSGAPVVRLPFPIASSVEAGMRQDHRLTRREFLECGASASLAGLVLLPRVAAGVDDLTLENATLAASWTIADGRFRPTRLTDRLNARELPLPAAVFRLTLGDGTALDAADMRVVAGPRSEVIRALRGAARAAERESGRRVSLTLRDVNDRLEVRWLGELREHSAYLRQEVTLRALKDPLAVREIRLIELSAPGATVSGTVPGSPVVSGSSYVALEHPLSDSRIDGDRVSCSLARELPIRPGAPSTSSCVIGVTRPGQLRRDFLQYIERERAHPYRTFLHYNSWYDLGYFSKFAEPEALAVIDAFGRELQRSRGVTLSSFLFDDGWDDPKTLWGFNAGFPKGFSRLRSEAARYGAAPGVWMSPWGGYGKPKADRIAEGRAKGYETNDGGFALSGPVYYARFRETCLRMIHRYGVNQFKFDGTGNADRAFPGSVFDSDFDAAIALIGDLRHEKPDLFVNLTTGTYPSPFWLRYADSIWRGGEDHEFAGTGTDRQRWITYRDADTYANVVRRGALYPLNSLMLHGMIYARSAHNLNTDPAGDFTSEIRSYFGTGTQLQEMYITPTLLSKDNWDTLAEAANWSRRNAGTLVDTHWIGGDPGKLEPYGWASWSAAGGILTLRNPGGTSQSMAIDAAQAFELPDGAPRTFSAGSPWQDARGRGAPLALRAGETQVFTLQPYEVLTLEATPV